jgi:hypothetical protein
VKEILTEVVQLRAENLRLRHSRKPKAEPPATPTQARPIVVKSSAPKMKPPAAAEPSPSPQPEPEPPTPAPASPPARKRGLFDRIMGYDED